jgi:DIS3-like exonuclease 1
LITLSLIFQVLGVWHGRTVIRSSYKLSYEVAQDILDGKTETEMKNEVAELAMFSGDVLTKKFSKLKETLELLSRVAKVIQTRREKEGALRLESAEVTFEFQRSSLEDIKPKQHLAVHETVAECMIFANQWVAKKISK